MRGETGDPAATGSPRGWIRDERQTRPDRGLHAERFQLGLECTEPVSAIGFLGLKPRETRFLLRDELEQLLAS